MFTKIEHFKTAWVAQSEGTGKLLAALTDASLGQEVSAGHRTLGRIAWHLVTSITEMAERTGLRLSGPRPDAPVPKSAREIRKAHEEAGTSLLEQVTMHWNDRTLEVEDDMYGEKWKRGLTLAILVNHESHHRGQMTVLMRQAGLKVPGVVGPAKEEWAQYNMPAPEV
jgi:uncharacterized damage-inducible protein DinB